MSLLAPPVVSGCTVGVLAVGLAVVADAEARETDDPVPEATAPVPVVLALALAAALTGPALEHSPNAGAKPVASVEMEVCPSTKLLQLLI